jgi:DNA-3-methyladenine glycosylase
VRNAKTFPEWRDSMEENLARKDRGCSHNYVPLQREFYLRETLEVAKELLGKILVRCLPENTLLEGRIVEVEAYRGTLDPASHAYRGLTERNKPLFGEVGHAYVYFVYGNHYCLNAAARDSSAKAGGVLLRAIEPFIGIERMLQNRGFKNSESLLEGTKGLVPPSQLSNGPGKLTKAMRITVKQSGIDLTDRSSEIFIRGGLDEGNNFEIASSKRVGVSRAKNKPWRFYIKGNRFVSKK